MLIIHKSSGEELSHTAQRALNQSGLLEWMIHIQAVWMTNIIIFTIHQIFMLCVKQD